MNTRLLILGTGPFAFEVAALASDIQGVSVEGFVENLEPDKAGHPLEGYPVFWIDEVASLASTHQAVCSLATPERRGYIEEVSALGMSFAVLVHPHAHVASTSTLLPGTIVCPGVVVATDALIGSHVRLNRGSLVGHHTRIGDFSTIQPGANIAGICELGTQVYVGMGALIRERLHVGDRAIVGAGSLVLKDVPAGAKVLGSPARIVEPEGGPA